MSANIHETAQIPPHRAAAERLQAALAREKVIVDADALSEQIQGVADAILAKESRRRTFSPVMDKLTSKIIAMADSNSIVGNAVGRLLIDAGLGYASDQMNMQEAKGQNLLENPVIATILAAVELAPEVGGTALGAVLSAVPVLGTAIGIGAGELVDVGVGTVIAGVQGSSYLPTHDVTDPAGKGTVHHWGAEGLIAVTGPTPYLNTTIALGLMRGCGRSLLRQLQGRPEYSQQIATATAHAAAIRVGTDTLHATGRRR